MPILGSHIQCVLCHDLLTLTKGHIVKVLVVYRKAQLLPQLLYILQWVYSRTQDKEDWSAWPGLLVRLVKRNASFLNVLATELFLNIEPKCGSKI